MIGATTSQSLDLTLLNKGDMVYGTSTIKVEIGLKIGNTIEYIPMGIYNIDDIEKTDYTIKITAFDNMMKFEKNFITNLGDTLTLQQVVNELVRITGVQFTGTLPSYSVKKLEGFSCREVLSYVASLCGGNAIITRDGKFTIVTPKDINYSIGTSNYFDYTREETKYKIGKISCQVADKVLSKGSLGADSMELEFENPWVTDSILQDIYSKLNGFEYLGYSMKWQGDLSLDVGDIVTITDKKGVVRKHPILSQKFTYTGGLTSEISAKGENKNKNEFSSSGSTAKKVERIVTELAIVNKALIDVAYIGDLTAGNIKFDTASGTIMDLQTLLSKFVTGENGQFLNLTTDNVVIANAVIKDAMIDSLSLNKLKAGTIDSNKINIVSADGGLSIVGPTMQFKDSSKRVRLQLGQDTSGNFSFILRGTDGTTTLIDHTGIKEKAIADDLIKEKMIAENAVGEKQINYSSLITGLNKDTNTQLIKASKVAIDLTGQSLEVSFNSLKSNVDSKESRNLLIGEKLIIQAGTVAKEKVSNYHFKFTNTQVNNTHIMWNGANGVAINAKAGDYITLSFFIKSNFKTQCKIIGKSGITNIETKLFNTVASEDFQKVVLTSKILIDNPEIFIYLSDYRVFNEFGVLELKDWKLEKGENTNPVWTPAPEDVEEKIESNTTAITATQKGIEALVKDTTITKGDVTTLKDNYTSIKATVDGINSTVAGHTTSIGKLTTDLSGVSGKVTEVETKQATLEQNLNGFKTTVSNTYSTKTELNTAKSDAINSANSSTDNKLKNYSTTTAMNSAITQSANGVKTEVSNTYLSKGDAVATYATKSSLEQTATDVIYKFTESGGYNLLKNSAFANKNIDGWVVWGGVSRYSTESYYTEVGDMYIANSSSNPGGLWQTGIPIKPNTKYTLSVTCTKEPNVKDGWFVLEYQSSIDSNVITYQDVKLNFDGQRHSYTFATPNNSNIKYTKCGFRHEGVKSTGGGYLIKINKPCLAEGEVSVWSPNPFEVKDGSTMIDANGVTIYNGALTVKNKSNANVLTGDSNGNLTITGTFINKNNNGVDAIKIDSTNIYFYDWDRNARELGIIYSSSLTDYPNVKGFSFAHNQQGYMTLGYRKEANSFGSYITFDKYSINPTYAAPIRVHEGAVFQSAVNMQDRVYIPQAIYFDKTNSSTTAKLFKANNANQLVMEVSVTNVGDGFLIQSNTGGTLGQIRAGETYPILLNTNTYIGGNLAASGSKNSLQTTKNYGERLINAYETAEYFFGDIGSGIIKDGECIVWIDDIFQECINTNIEYHIFTQIYNGSINKIERYKNYFIVYGEDNTEFSWELKAKRLGYENVRLDQPDIAGYLDSSAVFTEDDFEPITSENLLIKELEFNLEEILMEVS